MEWRDVLQLSILLMVLPTQYFLSNWSGSTETTRSVGISRLLTDLEALHEKWLNFDAWAKWFDRIAPMKTKPDPGSDEDESPALEVLKYRAKKTSGHFGTSDVPRSPRDLRIKYRVGQVIRHKKFGYLGVIVGWDPMAKAPEDWLHTMHGSNDHWRKQPNYVVLVDTRYRDNPQQTYVVEDNIEIVRHQKIQHFQLEDHFSAFDGSQYLPRPWLRHLYPHD